MCKSRPCSNLNKRARLAWCVKAGDSTGEGFTAHTARLSGHRVFLVPTALTIILVMVPGAGWILKLVGVVLQAVLGLPFLFGAIKAV